MLSQLYFFLHPRHAIRMKVAHDAVVRLQGPFVRRDKKMQTVVVVTLVQQVLYMCPSLTGLLVASWSELDDRVGYAVGRAGRPKGCVVLYDYIKVLKTADLEAAWVH